MLSHVIKYFPIITQMQNIHIFFYVKMQDLPLEYLGKASASHLEKTKILTWEMKETNLSKSNYKDIKKTITNSNHKRHMYHKISLLSLNVLW